MADSGSGDDEKTPPPSRPGGGGGSGKKDYKRVLLVSCTIVGNVF